MLRDEKVFIMGVGRSGTSFLVGLLTELGLDTGFSKDDYSNHIFENCKSGLEHESIENSPYIVKNPNFSLQIPVIIETVKVNMIYIPFRDFHESAYSRINIGEGQAGGLWLTNNPEEQYEKLCYVFGKLMSDAIAFNIPFTIIDFKKMISNPEYLFNQLNFLLGNIEYEKFLAAYEKSRPFFINKKENSIFS